MLLVLLLPLLLPGGCYHYVRTTDAQRANSLPAGLRYSTVDGETLQHFVRRRTAILMAGGSALAAHPDGSTLAIDFQPDARRQLSYAHATAIERDGYFLTAAHCVAEPVNYLIYLDAAGPRAAPARVVARAYDETEQTDLAILHVDGTLAEVFDWSDDRPLRKRTPVIAVGCADPAWLPRRTRYYADVCIGGHVTSTKRSSGAAAMRVFSDVPLRTGDSGGPLVASDGKLLAINTSGIMSWTGSGELVAASVRPDLAWVHRVIDEDRQTSRENTPVLPTTRPTKTRTRTLLFSLDGDQATPPEQSASSTPQMPSPP